MLIVLLVVLVPLVLLYQIRRKRRYEEFWKHLLAIPGPKTYPILGTNFISHSPESLFIRERKRSKKYYPIYRVWSIDVGAVILMKPEDIELVVNNPKHIDKGMAYEFLHAWLGTGLLTSGGAKWHKRRKILTPAFHFNILQEFIDMLNSETQILVQNLETLSEQPYVDVIKPITEFALYSIGETSLGIPLREDPECVQYKRAVYEMCTSFTYKTVRPWLWIPIIYRLSSCYRKEARTIKVLHDFSMNVIKEKQKVLAQSVSKSYSGRKRLALLDLMLTAKNEGADIDDEGIREEVDTFVFEGHDTTSVSLCFTLMALANEKLIQDEIYQEIISVMGESKTPSYNDLGELKFMERCIKESLRLYPSVPMIGRLAGEDLKTNTGYTIPKTCNIHMSIYDLHRDPEIWEDPEKFDPDRFLPDNIAKRHPYAYIPFSAGSRNCIGQKFAILELKTALCGILRNFELYPVDTPADVKFKSDIVLRPSGEIRVKFLPRSTNVIQSNK